LIARERVVLKQLWSGPIGGFMPGFVAALFVAAALSATPASAQPEIFPTAGITWTVQPAFGQSGEGRDNVSGATCMATPLASRTPCLVVNDSTNFAQIFSVVGTTIRPGSTVGITAAPPPGTLAFNPNMEGAGHDDRFFYVVSSRGRAGSPGQTDTSFLVARFGIDAGTPPPAAPPVPFASGTTVGGIQISDRIRTALAAGIPVPDLAGQQLDRTNAEIEGIAVKERQSRPVPERVLHLGFRAPVLGGKAFIVSALVDNVFATSGPLNPTVTALALGGNIGIRDLAAVSAGLVILAGPGRDLTERASLFHRNDTTGQLKQLAIIAEPANRNGEALLVLQDSHIVDALVGTDARVIASYFRPTVQLGEIRAKSELLQVDVRQRDVVRAVVARSRPTTIFHLAAQKLSDGIVGKAAGDDGHQRHRHNQPVRDDQGGAWRSQNLTSSARISSSFASRFLSEAAKLRARSVGVTFSRVAMLMGHATISDSRFNAQSRFA
jgi:hypothetical protein